jgi:hypothetical protein
VILGIFVIPNVPRPKRTHNNTWKEVAQELDLLGGVVGVTALVLINFAWSTYIRHLTSSLQRLRWLETLISLADQAGVVSWSQPYIYVLLIVGIVLVPVFFYIEFKVAESPLIPIDVFNAEVGFVLGCIVCGWGSFGVWSTLTCCISYHRRMWNGNDLWVER